MELTVGIVIDEVEAILVVDGAKVGLGDGKTNRVGKALTERSSSHFDT